MTTGIPSIDLFNAMNAAEAAMIASDYDLDLCKVADKAREDFYAKMKTLRDAWNAIPNSDAKGSAIDSAYDTEGTDENELLWLDIAARTYEMNIDCGYYNADGSEK
jgi:hypothetical protein